MWNPWPFALGFLYTGVILITFYVVFQNFAKVKTHSFQGANESDCVNGASPGKWARGVVGMICFEEDAPPYPVWLKILFWTGWSLVLMSVVIFAVYSIWDLTRN